MALDFTKLTATVKSVADLAASHADLKVLAKDAKAVECAAQAELDSIVAALEAALNSTTPLTPAEAVGVTAVATALSAPVPLPEPAAPAVEPILYNGLPPVEFAAVPEVAVGVVAPVPPPAPKSVEEYNEMRAKGLIP